MKMGDAVIIRLCNQWCHRDDIFRIIVLDGTEITKLTLVCVIVSYYIGSLHIYPFAFWFCTNKIYLTSLKLSDHHVIAQTDKMVVNDILYHLFNISLT